MTETIRITGMTCGHCARRVERAATNLPDVGEVRIDLRAGTLSYEGSAARERVAAAVREAGYDVAE